MKTPVIFIIFNRPKQTRTVFHSIAAAKPPRLLIIADGPRVSHPGDENLCKEVRAIAGKVDWPCEVFTNFSDSNLGCGERIVTGLNWAFSLVEEAIILEDDCLPHVDFFGFCEEILDRFCVDSRIGCISGTNLDPPNRKTAYSYYFSRLGGNWGWATWRRAWLQYDRELRDWRHVQASGVLREVWPIDSTLRYWSTIFDTMHANVPADVWDYQWLYTKVINSMLSIVPSVNMVRNIGFGADCTHTAEAPKWARGLLEHPIEFPLKHPPFVIPMRSFDDLDQQIAFPSPTFLDRAIKKVKRAGSHMKHVISQKIAIT